MGEVTLDCNIRNPTVTTPQGGRRGYSLVAGVEFVAGAAPNATIR
jgi:hypothetical protein